MSETGGVDVSVDAAGDITVTVVESGGVDLVVEATTTVVELEVAVPGVQGPPGPRGLQGPAGPEGGAYQDEVVFAIPALVWEAEHTLARQPNVTCFTFGGERIEGDPSYPSPTTVRITWAVPVSGTLRLT